MFSNRSPVLAGQGDTLFCHVAAAFAELPAPLRRQLHDLVGASLAACRTAAVVFHLHSSWQFLALSLGQWAGARTAT